MNPTKIYLPIYLLLYLLVAFIIPTYRTYKITGINPVTFGKNDNAHDYIGFVMKLIMVVLTINVLLFSFAENLYSYLSPIKILKSESIFYFGFILIHTALIWICFAQFQMSSNWRIGIDEKNKTDLVTTGIFSISRNPIFLGMIVSLIGIFFIIPNALTFCLVVLTYFVIQIQIRLEEEFLEKQHKTDYINYKFKTRRLI